MNTLKAIVKEGKIELLEPAAIADGTQLLVTVLSEDAKDWSEMSGSSLKTVWDNEDDNVYHVLSQNSHLKRVEQIPTNETMSLDEISEIVHEAR